MEQNQDDTAENDLPARKSPSHRTLVWDRQGNPGDTCVAVAEDCGAKIRLQRASQNINLKDIPVGVRLNVARKTHLEQIKEKIEKPEGRVPRTFLPKWPVMSMDNKIPYLNCPYDLIYFSRGKLGENLWRKGQEFYIYDPELRDRVIGETYNALHDPHARNYLQSPVVQKVLKEQGLVNRRGEVICNVAVFNKFRNYLRNLYASQVTAALCSMDQAMQRDNMQMRQIRKEMYETEGTGAVHANRTDFARGFTAQQQKERQESLASKQAEDADRLNTIRRNRDERQICRILRSWDRAQIRSQRMHEFFEQEESKRQMLVSSIAIKEKTAEERRMQEENLNRLAIRKYKVELLDSRFDFGEEMLQKQEEISKAYKEDLQRRTARRQRRMEHERAILPEMVAKRKKAAKRLEDIVRKYAMRWLDKVRQRKKRKPDAMHLSLWETNIVLDETNKYLRQESGYEKLDDFILSIIRLKEEIRAQLEAEEKAEALAAAAEEEGEMSAISPEDLVEDILEDVIDNATSLYASNVVEKFITDFMGKVQSKCSKVLKLTESEPQEIPEPEHGDTDSGITVSIAEEPKRKPEMKRKARGRRTITESQMAPRPTQTRSENIVSAEHIKVKPVYSDSGIPSDRSTVFEVEVDPSDSKNNGGDNLENIHPVVELFKNPKEDFKEESASETEISEKNASPQFGKGDSPEKDSPGVSVENVENSLHGKGISGFQVISEVESSVSKFIAKSECVLDDILSRNAVFSSKSSYSDFSNDVYDYLEPPPMVKNNILEKIPLKTSSSQESLYEEEIAVNISQSIEVAQLKRENCSRKSSASTASSKQEISRNKSTGSDSYNESQKNDSVQLAPVINLESQPRTQFFDSVLKACSLQAISLEKYAQITTRKKKPVMDKKDFPRYRLMKRGVITPSRTFEDKSALISEVFEKGGVSYTNIADYHETRRMVGRILGRENVFENTSWDFSSRPATTETKPEASSKVAAKFINSPRRILTALPNALKISEDFSDTRSTFSAATVKSTWSGFEADTESRCESENLEPSEEKKRNPGGVVRRSISRSSVPGGPYISTPFPSQNIPLKVKCTVKSDKSDTNLNLKRPSIKYLQFEVSSRASKSNSSTSCKNQSSTSCTRLPLHQLPKSRRAFYQLVSPSSSSTQQDKCEIKVTVNRPVQIRGTSSGTRLPTIGPFCQIHLKNTEEVYKPQIRRQSSYTKLPSIHLNTPRRQESNSSFLSIKDYPLKDIYSNNAKPKEDHSRLRRNGSAVSIQPLIPTTPYFSFKPSSTETDSQSESVFEFPSTRQMSSAKRKKSYLPSIITFEKQLVAKDEKLLYTDSKWIRNKSSKALPAVEVLGRALIILEHSIKRTILPDILKYMFDDDLTANLNPLIQAHKKKDDSENAMLTSIAKISFSMAKDCANYERVTIVNKREKDNAAFLDIYGTKYSKQIQDICLSVAVSILNHISDNGFDVI